MNLATLTLAPTLEAFDADAHTRGASDRAAVLVVGGSIVPLPALVDIGAGVAVVTGTGPASARPRVELHMPTAEPASVIFELSPDAAHILGVALIEHASIARLAVEL